MKTILFIEVYPFHPLRGGIQRVGDILTKSLSKRGYKILHLSLKQPQEYLDWDYPVPCAKFPSERVDDPQNYDFLENFIKENNVDIVFNHCMFSHSKLFLHRGKDDKTKKITLIHNNPQRGYSSLYIPKKPGLRAKFDSKWRKFNHAISGADKKLWNKMSRTASMIYEKSDKVVVLSKSYIPKFIELVPNALTEEITAVPNANTFPKQEVHFESKKKKVIFIARLQLDPKRPDRMIDAWRAVEANFPDWELDIIGDGGDKKFLEKYAKGIARINFVGYQDPEPYLREASILCMTSNFEGFPMVLAEAMIHGTVPIAFSSFPSIYDIIEENKNGLLAQAFSIDDFAEKLSVLMKDKVKREEMGHYGMQSVEKFDIELIVDRWVELFS